MSDPHPLPWARHLNDPSRDLEHFTRKVVRAQIDAADAAAGRREVYQRLMKYGIRTADNWDATLERCDRQQRKVGDLYWRARWLKRVLDRARRGDAAPAIREVMAEIYAIHYPIWTSEEAKAAGKDPWVCGVCGTADGSWPCATYMLADDLANLGH